MLRAEMSSTMELVVPLLCLVVLSCSGSTSAAGAEPEKIIVTEGNEVTLPCSTSGDITSIRFEWKKDGQKKKEVYVHDGRLLSGQHDQFIDRVSHFPGELEKGNASITIRDTEVTDTGNYTCEFPRLNQKILINLLVGAAPTPSISTYNRSDTWQVMKCEVRRASPKPQLLWQDGAGNNLPAKGLDFKGNDPYDVTLYLNVTEANYYRCVSIQEDIKHKIYAEIYMTFKEPSTGWIIAVVVLGILLVGVVFTLIVLIKKGCLRCNSGQSKIRVSQDDQ